jgi:predicted lipoprotein with Yx(FWY)xxD motif
MRTSRAAAPLLLLLLGAAVGACSTTTGNVAGVTGTPAAASADPGKAGYGEAAATEAPAAGGPAVNVGDTSLGKVVVDGKGMTLYIFTPDSGGKSVCNGDCAKAWPPLPGGSAATLGTGLDAEDFTVITRDDGSSQVAFYGMPLYHFAGDKAAGDVNGQGLNDKWYVVGADGKPVK